MSTSKITITIDSRKGHSAPRVRGFSRWQQLCAFQATRQGRHVARMQEAWKAELRSLPPGCTQERRHEIEGVAREMGKTTMRSAQYCLSWLVEEERRKWLNPSQLTTDPKIDRLYGR